MGFDEAVLAVVFLRAHAWHGGFTLGLVENLNIKHVIMHV